MYEAISSGGLPFGKFILDMESEKGISERPIGGLENGRPAGASTSKKFDAKQHPRIANPSTIAQFFNWRD